MKWLSAIAMILMLTACKGRQEESPVTEVSYMMVPGPDEEKPMAPPKKGQVQRKFIKNGRIEFETEDVDATRKAIMAAVKANNAFVSNDKEDLNKAEITYTMWVHVPAVRFDSFLSSATKGITAFRHKSISIEDVTARYVDTGSRLKTKKEIENRYRALLAKAATVKDILEIEKELGEIRTSIEATEAQFTTLNNEIEYSTMQIVFFKPLLTSNPFLREVADAFKEGLANLRAFTVVLIAVWPFVLLAGGVVVVLTWWRKKRKMVLKQEAAELL
jgi:hypothetical protein